MATDRRYKVNSCIQADDPNDSSLFTPGLAEEKKEKKGLLRVRVICNELKYRRDV